MPAAIAAPAPARHLELELKEIHPSPFNHRKRFTGIEELAESIKSHGVISPVTVRDRPGVGPVQRYELVVGERRWRAAKLARIATIPAIVRELTDKEVLEIQLIENVQRVDVHPLEEADGYEELLTKHGYDVDGIAAKTGKSKAYVYGRLKLGALAEVPREAFLADKLSASIALLIARIPDAGLQEKATREILGEPEAIMGERYEDIEQDDPLSPERRDLRIDENDDLVAHDARPDVGMPRGRAQLEPLPMSFREAQVHLRRRYMLRLELATFDLGDAQLVAKAGACTTCEYRTGNQRELFAEVSSADVCTHPTCFETKTRAAWDEKAAAAKAQGQKVVEQDKTVRMFSPVDGRTVAGSSPYVDPKAQVPHDLVAPGMKPPTWEKMLGKKLDAPRVLVQDQTGAARELLDKNAAVKLLRDAGKIDKPEKPSSSRSGSHSEDWQKREDKRKQEQDVRARAHRKLLRDAVTEISKAPDPKKELAQWKWIIAATLDTQEPELLIDLLGVKNGEAALAMVDSVSKARQLLFAIAFASFTERTWSAPEKDSPLLVAVKLLGLNYDKAIEAAKAEAKIAEKAEKAIAEKKIPAKGAKKK